MKNIYRTACWIACLLCCVHTLCGKNVEGDVNYVLIINTYTESTPWSNSMIYPIVSMASQDEKLGVYTEHMNMLMMEGEGNWLHLRKIFLRILRPVLRN